MEPPNDTTKKPVGVGGDTATSTESDSESDNETDGFIFGNNLASDGAGDTLAEREQERVVDLVRLQPTKNANLQDQWGLGSGTEVHQYLESQLKEYYYRDSDGYIRATDAAEEFVQHHQDATEPDNEPDEASDLQRRDLVIALVTLTQELGHLLSADEINEHGEYRHQRYQEEFGDLFNAYQAAGILPDGVTRTDFYGEDPDEPSEPDKSEAEPTSDPETPSEAKQEPESEGKAEAEEDTSEAPATSTETEPSRQELLDEIKRLDASLDRIPYESDIDQVGRFTAYTYRNRFGSWDESLEAAGINKEAVLLEDMQQVADTVDGDLSQPAMNEHGKYSASMAARFFGSWSDAKERLEGWEASKDEEDASAAESVEIDASSVDRLSFDVPDDVDDANLLKEIQRFADIINEPPTEELVVAYGRYPANAYRAAFGSWDAALETAGYDPGDIPDWSNRSHTNVDILDGLRTVADELKRAPTTTETGNHVDFSPGLASLRFGSWSDALEVAGLDPSKRSSVQDRASGKREDATADDRELEDDDVDVVSESDSEPGSDVDTAANGPSSSSTPDAKGASPDSTDRDLSLPRDGPLADGLANASKGRLSGVAVEVVDVSKVDGSKRTAEVDLRTTADEVIVLDVWEKHDVDWSFEKGDRLRLDEVRLKRWKTGSTPAHQLSTTKDFSVTGLEDERDTPVERLTGLAGATRDDAEILVEAGYECHEDLEAATLEELRDLPDLDDGVALRIKAELG